MTINLWNLLKDLKTIASKANQVSNLLVGLWPIRKNLIEVDVEFKDLEALSAAKLLKFAQNLKSIDHAIRNLKWLQSAPDFDIIIKFDIDEELFTVKKCFFRFSVTRNQFDLLMRKLGKLNMTGTFKCGELGLNGK